MLKSFFVKDYALIDEINVEFSKGINIITGETGAGKSILIDAMGLLLGERASTEVIRKDESKAIVEGIFDVTNNKKVREFCEKNEFDFEDSLILRREVSIKGNSRCFINDSPSSLALFKEIGNLLVDLHGQHEHQTLLRNETHIDYLDEYALPSSDLADYKEEYILFHTKIDDYNKLLNKENELKEKRDFLQFQLDEFDKINPKEGEDEEIQSELNILENSEQLLQLSQTTYNQIYEADNSLFDYISSVINSIKEIAEIDKNAEPILSDLENAKLTIKETASFLREYASNIDIDPEHLDKQRLRLSKINHLKKKYSGDLPTLIKNFEKIRVELDLADNFTHSLEKLKKEIDAQKNKCFALALELHNKRKNAAQKAEKEIVSILKTMGIEKSVFKIRFSNLEEGSVPSVEKVKLNPKGFDTIEFMISLNPGEDLKSLSRTASGGEISRIMLALKSILAKSDKLPLLIFDEIDTGVSGRIAQKIGKVLSDLAERHQIISITHLPQIAGFADTHFVVRKEIQNSRVSSIIAKLNMDERIVEVAKLLSGEKVTEASLSSARELIKQS